MDLVELEAAAYRAWPAAEVEDLGAWRLRFTDGVTRRGNSVWTYGASGAPVDACIARAEAFYAERGRRAMFQLGPLTRPDDLDERLAERGYAIDAPVSLQTAAAAAVASVGEGLPTAELCSGPDAEWWALAGAGSRFRDVPDVYRALLARMPGRVGYALVRQHGATVATGLGVAEGRWLGVYSMLTAPDRRGRGLGRALLASLGRFAVSAGATHLYLQVERDNPSALSLYARAGFRELAGYRYRVAPAA